MTLKEIFENLNSGNYESSVKEMYKIQEADKRDWKQLSEFEKDVYCWLTDDMFNEERVSRIQIQIDEKRR